MLERFDRMLDALDRLVADVRRGVDALERIATTPSGKLPAVRRGQRRQCPARPPEGPIDELAVKRAQSALRRNGLR